MMYSPHVLDPRPRPPGAVRRPGLGTHQHITSSVSMGLGSFDTSETPLHKQTSRHFQASPTSRTEEDEVSIELTSERRSLSPAKRVIGLGLPADMPSDPPASTTLKRKGHEVQPSPPPPYGPILNALAMNQTTSVSTPPTQDVESDPLENSWTESRSDEDEEEESQRRRRATDAARSLGLVIQLSPSATSVDASGEELLDEEAIRKQLKQMRSRLKARDQELLMAAQVAENVLRQHEELISVLPEEIKVLLPQLGPFSTSGPDEHLGNEPTVSGSAGIRSNRASASTPSRSSLALDAAFTLGGPSDRSGSSARSSTTPGTEERRFFRTVRSGDSSRPFPDHNNRHARNIFSTPLQHRTDSYAELVRQEADDRLVLLERALSEARENEEVQRKVAARLKRDFDKLQREFEYAAEAVERAESSYAQASKAVSSAESVTSSQFDTWAWKQRSLSEQGDQMDERVLRPRASRVKLRIKSKVKACTVPQRGADLREKEAGEDDLVPDDAGWGLTRFPQFPTTTGAGPSRYRDDDVEDRLTKLPPRPTFGRLKAKLRNASPKKASPRRMSTVAPSLGRHRSQSSFGSVSDSPSVLHRALSPDRHASTPMSRYNSIASHVASVRKYVSESVRSAAILGRSLGSELGSEYGESEVGDHDATFTRDTARESTVRRRIYRTGKADIGSESEIGDGESHPIPSTASSGLSSLALALAPTSPPRLSSSRRSPEERPLTHVSVPVSCSKRSLSPTTPGARRRRSPGRLSGSPASRSRNEPGSFRPKKGRNNWIRPLQLPRTQGLQVDATRRRSGMQPRACSDGSLTQSRRRYLRDVGTTTSQMLKEVATARMGLDSIASSATMLLVDSKDELEKDLDRDWLNDPIPRTELLSPPARLVNDVIILLSILLEWIEMFVVIVWRVFVTVRYGRNSLS